MMIRCDSCLYDVWTKVSYRVPRFIDTKPFLFDRLNDFRNRVAMQVYRDLYWNARGW